MMTQETGHRRIENNIVKIKIWRVTGLYGEIGVYFTGTSANEAKCYACSGWGDVTEKIVEAIKA